MPEIKIKEQTLAARCEICHQSDCFDAATNSCSRCGNLQLPELSVQQSSKTHKRPPQPYTPDKKIFINAIAGTLFMTFFIFLATLWLASVQSNFSPIVIAIIVSLVFIKLYCDHIKRMILRATPNSIEVWRTHPSDYDNLDTYSLDNYTSQITALGFIDATNIKLKFENGRSFPSMTHVFFSPTYSCIFEVSQFFLPDTPASAMRCTVISKFEQDWLLASSNREPDPSLYVIRTPQRLTFNYVGATPEQLLQTHLAKREQIARELGIKILPCPTFEQYAAESYQYSRVLRKRLEKINMIKGLLDGAYFEIFPQTEWLGDYPKVAAKRKKNIG